MSGIYQATALAGRRCSAAVAYLKPARRRSNLVVLPDAHATRILIEVGRAVGIQYRTPRGHATARSAGDVIVIPALAADLDGPVYGERETYIERPTVVERERIIERHYYHEPRVETYVVPRVYERPVYAYRDAYYDDEYR